MPRRMSVYFGLLRALAREFRWGRMMETGRYATINELPATEKINSSCVFTSQVNVQVGR